MPLLITNVRLPGNRGRKRLWVNRSGVQRPGRARAAYMWELETGLSEAGIEIPFPQRDLHIRSSQIHRQPSAELFEIDSSRPTESGGSSG